MGVRGFGTLVAALLIVSDASAQRPRFGVGVGGGIVLGSQLVDHRFTATLDEQAVSVAQQVTLTDAAIASFHGEIYLGRHFALRLHAARGAGRLEVTTAREDAEELDAAPFETGFGNARVSAIDAGIGIWPWTPRSVGFAPFITVGLGRYRYSFDAAPDSGAFFRGPNERTRRALVVGAGADMNVWRSVMLRIEAVNHLVDPPLATGDFAFATQQRRGPGAELGTAVSNVRLVLGAHVYFPFWASEGIPH